MDNFSHNISSRIYIDEAERLNELLLQLNLQDCLNLLKWLADRIRELTGGEAPDSLGRCLEGTSQKFDDELGEILLKIELRDSTELLYWLEDRISWLLSEWRHQQLFGK